MRTFSLIACDLFRYYGRVGVSVFLKAWLVNRGFNYTLWFRVASANIPLISGGASIVLRWKQIRYRIEIHKGTMIGPGLYLGHGGPCFVHPSARIGANVNISQCVTIGSNHGKAAVIGDNVYIGPNAVIVEDVTIGDRVTIGAGAIVTRSIPSDCTAAGNPARVLNANNPGRYINFPCRLIR